MNITMIYFGFITHEQKTFADFSACYHHRDCNIAGFDRIFI